MAVRVVEARKRLRQTLSRMGGLNARDARLVADFYEAGRRQGGAGVVRPDPVAGGFSVTHGAYMDRSTIKNALAAAREWDAAGRKATRKPRKNP